MTPNQPTQSQPTHAGLLDPHTAHAVVAMLGERMADAVCEPIDIVIAHLRAGQMALKNLCDIEKRNAELLESCAQESWTRLATMKPFHPDDQAELEARMARHRAIVLAQGRREAQNAPGTIGHDMTDHE